MKGDLRAKEELAELSPHDLSVDAVSISVKFNASQPSLGEGQISRIDKRNYMKTDCAKYMNHNSLVNTNPTPEAMIRRKPINNKH